MKRMKKRANRVLLPQMYNYIIIKQDETEREREVTITTKNIKKNIPGILPPPKLKKSGEGYEVC